MNENQTDKLRIQIYQSSNLKVLLGKKDIPLTLLPRKLLNNENESNFVNSNSLNAMFNANLIQNSQTNQNNGKS